MFALEDTQIIDLYWARDELALKQTDLKYGGYCRAIAQNILGVLEDTEECVWDTWLHAWNAMPPQRPAILRAFLGRITRNLSFDRYKASHAEKRGGGSVALAIDELTACIPAAPDAQKAVEDKELSQAIDRFLRSLPERECNVFLRRYWYAESIETIASRFRLNQNTVKSILFRTREKLRVALEEEGIAL